MIALLFALALPAYADGPDVPRSWAHEQVDRLPKSLLKKIKKSNKLLAKKEYVEFLDAWMPASVRKKIDPSDPRFLAEFEGDKGQALTKAFAIIPEVPVYRLTRDDQVGWAAQVKGTVDVPKDLVFVEEDGDWRIMN